MRTFPTNRYSRLRDERLTRGIKQSRGNCNLRSKLHLRFGGEGRTEEVSEVRGGFEKEPPVSPTLSRTFLRAQIDNVVNRASRLLGFVIRTSRRITSSRALKIIYLVIKIWSSRQLHGNPIKLVKPGAANTYRTNL
ncbi:hypothetical protein J6590_029515 [Homalodisca vitripennis]|nr:hypothetical protein J6590_029515 [Homalodisca vitripennis]